MLTAIPNRRILLQTLLIGCLGLALASAVFYPGFGNGDANWQLGQAQEGHYNDWHPPVMSFLWHFLNLIIPGTGGMFVFQLALFWLGLALFVRHALRSPTLSVLMTFLIGFYFPILCTFGVITKDGSFLGAMVFTCGMFLHAECERSWTALSLGHLGLAYALAVRHNAFMAVFPLAMWGGTLLFDYRPFFTRWPALQGKARPWMLGMMVFTLLGASIEVLELIVIRPKPARFSQAIMLFDVMAVSADKNTNYLPNFYDRGRPRMTAQEIKTIFDPLDSMPLLWPPPSVRGPGFLWTQEEMTLLTASWFAVLINEPGIYLKHRFRMFMGLLGFGIQSNWPYWFPSNQTLDSDPKFNRPEFNIPVKKWIISRVNTARNTALFHGWSYIGLIACTMMLGLFFKVRSKMAFWTMAWSALLYEAGYFVMAPGCHFRYSVWPMGASLILPLLLDIRRDQIFRAMTSISPTVALKFHR